jgi:hypothetical protein
MACSFWLGHYDESLVLEYPMGEMHDDLEALKGYVEELRADRTAQKQKERREAWTRYVSLTIVIVAVFAAIATQWSGKYSGRTLAQLNDATFNQTQAANQWAYYQAKSVKQNLYEVSQAQLPAGTDPKTLKAVEERIARYEKEKGEIKAAAEALEQKRDKARDLATAASEKGSSMSLCVAILTIAIAMASICLVTKKKPLWLISIGLACVAVSLMIHTWMK